jgi:tRNA(Ile2) C34 agmatinyltransferase TiaS
MRPWEFPNCPVCGTEIYVARAKGRQVDFECYNCNVHWSEEDRAPSLGADGGYGSA